MTGVIAAAGIGAAGAIGSAVAPKLFGGSSGTTGTQQQSGNSSTQSGPALGTPYLSFENQQLANIQGLTQQPFRPYDVNSMFAPLNATQNKAFGQVDQATGSWQPYFGNASGSLSQNSGAAYDPTKAAATAFGNAQSTPSALSTANPYATSGGQNSYSNIQDYMNPYINNSVNAANQLQSSNFLNNVMPGINNQFVSSGGGLGSPQYGNAANMALTNFNQNIGNTTQGALASGYNSAMSASSADKARQAGLAGTMGNLALGQQAGNTALGSAMGNNAALGANTNIANANAWSGLGTGYLNNSLLGANALLQTGNQQQQNAQNPLTAAYQQFQQQVQFPYQQAGWAANTANAYNWPTQTNSQTGQTGSSSSVGTATGSPVGTGLGLAAGVGSLIGQTNNNAPAGSGTQYRRGGYFPRYASGGYLSINRDSMPPAMKPMPYFDGGLQVGYKRGGYFAGGGYLDINRDTMPPAMAPIPNNDFGPQIGYAQGGYLDINRPTMPPAMRAFPNNDAGLQIGYKKGGFFKFAAGGVAPVVKVMRAATKRSIAAAQAKEKAAQLKAQMARPNLPLDLSPRSGHFSQ